MPVHRRLPCIALKVNSRIYLFDPGEGCQARMFKHGLSPLKVEAVFITHGHGDHFLGLFGLVQTMTLSDRKDPLVVALPKSLREHMVVFSKLGMVKPGFKLDYLEVGNGFSYSDEAISVKAFPVNHTVESYGYHVQVGKKTICYTGDTAPCQSIVENCRGVDILIHDSTFTSMYAEEAREQGHSTAYDAARTALEVEAKLLVLFHVSARHSNDEVFFDAYRVFKNTVVARDDLVLLL